MSIFKLADDTIVSPGTPFEANGVLYPSNWIRHATPKEKKAIGLVEVIEDPRPDDRFYFVNTDPKNLGKFIKTPKDIDQIKSMLISQVNAYVSSILSQTDWKVMRAAENYKPISASLVAYRKAVRDNGNALVAEINGLTFIKLTTWQPHGWPVDPDATVGV